MSANMSSSDKPLTGVRILLVDDENMIREVVRDDLLFLGATTIEAEDGFKAIELLSKETVDVVVSDFRMPVCDGMEFAEKMKSQFAHPPPLLFLTGYADITSDNRDAISKYRILEKPYEIDSLLQIITELIRPSSTNSNPSNGNAA